MTDLPLEKTAETDKTITLGWVPPAGAEWYEFFADGKRVSSAPAVDANGNVKNSVKFGKVASGKYAVRALGISAEGVWPPVVPPPTPHVYPPPVLVNPRTYVVPSGATTVQLDKTQRDWIIDFGWLERKNRVLVYGWDGQRYIAKNGWCNIDKPVGGSAYGRGLIGVRSNDGVGPAEAYFDGMLAQGATIADAFVVDAGLKTEVTVANFRLECSRDTTGKQFNDGTEHIDQLQTQGKIGRLRLCNGTINLSDQSNPTDAGGKGLMLHKETGGPFTVQMQYVNFYGYGRNGATIFQNTSDIKIEIGDGVYMDLAQVTSAGYKWYANSAALYPNKWDSVGTAPNRVCIPRAVGWTGQILEGRPPGGDYVTRAIKP